MHKHVPVLLQESLEILNLSSGKIFLDGTLGSAGHSSRVAEMFGDKVEIIGLDKDKDALKRGSERLEALKAHFHALEASFQDLEDAIDSLDIEKVDAILLDIGISSDQLETSGRGFTFQKDEPLLMTMQKEPKEGDLTAKEILNTFDEDTLEIIIRGFGEEKFSRKIARKIVEVREEKPFETTFDLLEAVRAATPSFYHRGKIHPATRTFQAIRIAVNAELDTLEKGMQKGFEKLNPGGRLAIITFHSLEDRLVKNFFRERAKEDKAILLTKKPIVPSKLEQQANPRARSAKLRAIEKI